MKINISTTELNTYVNVNPLLGQDIREIPCEDGEAWEIIFDLTNFIPFLELEEYLNKLCSKLRHGGKLVVRGLDFEDICKDYRLRRISIKEVNELIFGGRTNPWDIQCGVFTMREVNEILSNKLKITKKRLYASRFVVEGERE